jgi:hypothetical protein
VLRIKLYISWTDLFVEKIPTHGLLGLPGSYPTSDIKNSFLGYDQADLITFNNNKMTGRGN